MPGETERRVMRHGKYSGVIALPPDYRRYHKLDPGANVKLIYDSLLLIIPPGCDEKLREREDLVRRLLE